nr:hypothetical protein LOC285989 [Homo sapiens]BAD18576.1 unnamed protein product [Homo sapiens]
MKKLTPKQKFSEDLESYKISVVMQESAEKLSEKLHKCKEFVDSCRLTFPTSGDEYSRGFLQNLNLIQDQNAQTRWKQGRYDEDGKPFNQRSLLLGHERILTRAKSYECSECGKVIRRKAWFDQHQRIHFLENPFECKVCGQAFRQRSALTVHKQCHLQNKPYRCHDCGKCFRQLAFLLNIRGFTPKKNLINVANVKKRLVRIQPLFDIR